MAAIKWRPTLAWKVTLLATLGMVGLGITAAIYLNGSAKENTFVRAADQAHAIADAVVKVHVGLLESRRAEKDFLLRNDAKYADRHAAQAAIAEADQQHLRKAVAESGGEDLMRAVDALIDGFAAYRSSFKAVVDAKMRLGLDPNSGLEGALRNAVHAIESKLAEFDEPGLTVTMLMMRRHEKDFMLRRDSRYRDEMKARASAFTAQLARSSLPLDAQDDIRRKLVAYQQSFLAWTEAAGDVTRAQKATSDAYAALEPSLALLLKATEARIIEADGASRATIAATKFQFLAATSIIAVAMGLIAAALGRSISGPLRAITDVMARLTRGELDIAIPGLGRADDIGELAGSIAIFQQSMRHNHELNATVLDQASAREVHAKGIEENVEKFRVTAGAMIEAVTDNARTMRKAAESITSEAARATTDALSSKQGSAQASASVQAVAAAAEELATSIAEINRQVAYSTEAVRKAAARTERSAAEIGSLDQIGQRIGTVVQMVSAIAAQTNLLALNATIEAARAGEAGRGFAVVAAEVKALAEQTAKATAEISDQVAAIQASTRSAVDTVREIGTSMQEINEVTVSIASAVEEQSAATNEITRNAQSAAQGNGLLTASIGSVTDSITMTSHSAGSVLSAAEDLAGRAEDLRAEMQGFFVKLRTGALEHHKGTDAGHQALERRSSGRDRGAA
jgi:methyl-accepting chemotaxis protein